MFSTFLFSFWECVCLCGVLQWTGVPSRECSCLVPSVSDVCSRVPLQSWPEWMDKWMNEWLLLLLVQLKWPNLSFLLSHVPSKRVARALSQVRTGMGGGWNGDLTGARASRAGWRGERRGGEVQLQREGERERYDLIRQWKQPRAPGRRRREGEEETNSTREAS